MFAGGAEHAVPRMSALPIRTPADQRVDEVIRPEAFVHLDIVARGAVQEILRSLVSSPASAPSQACARAEPKPEQRHNRGQEYSPHSVLHGRLGPNRCNWCLA